MTSTLKAKTTSQSNSGFAGTLISQGISLHVYHTKIIIIILVIITILCFF